MNDRVRPRACVAGWPVAQSRSPIIHGHWLKTYAIDGAYERIAVPVGSFREFADTIGRDGLRGSNVTVPHKETAFAICDSRTAAAEAMGAVNTLWREDGRLWGDNTDAHGFIGGLDDEAPGWRAEVKTAVVIGAGGAARAIVHALLTSGVDRVWIANRTPERARALSLAFQPRAIARQWSELPDLIGDADMVVNTTSLGMAGQPELDLDVDQIARHAIVMDIVYVPLRTALVKRAEARGLRAVGGLGMLLYQATAGFERWFGVRPKVTDELRRLVEADILRAQSSAS